MNLKTKNQMTVDQNQSKQHSPATWVPTLYFAMGMPFVVLNMVCTLMYKGMGVSDAQITFWTSLIMMPWTFKFLWSPFLELYRSKKFFVVTTQLVTGAGFALVGLALNLPHYFTVCIALMALIAFSGATHDIATDGVYMAELSKEDQARFIGWQGAFYNIAKIVASGGLVWLAGWLLKHYGGVKGAPEDVMHHAAAQAWMVVMVALGVLMLLLGFYHMRMLPQGGKRTEKRMTAAETLDELVRVLGDFFKKRHIFYYIAFIILYRFAEGFVMKVVPLFLKAGREVGGLGLSEEEIRDIIDSFVYMQNLEKRKEEVIRLIEEQGKLTEELKASITNASKLQEVEDLYLPYKKKKKTKADIAKEQGLEPLTEFALMPTTIFEMLEKEAEKYLSEEVLSIEDAING